MPIVNENHKLTKQSVFLDFSLSLTKNYREFPDYSRFSMTFHKNGLLSRSSRFSIKTINAYTVTLLILLELNDGTVNKAKVSPIVVVFITTYAAKLRFTKSETSYSAKRPYCVHQIYYFLLFYELTQIPIFPCIFE